MLRAVVLLAGVAVSLSSQLDTDLKSLVKAEPRLVAQKGSAYYGHCCPWACGLGLYEKAKLNEAGEQALSGVLPSSRLQRLTPGCCLESQPWLLSAIAYTLKLTLSFPSCF